MGDRVRVSECRTRLLEYVGDEVQDQRGARRIRVGRVESLDRRCEGIAWRCIAGRVAR